MPAPARIEDAEPWRASLRRLLERHGRGLTILEVRIDDQPAAVAAFSARVASTEVRAAYDTIRVALGGRRMIDVADREAVYTADLAPYVDLLVLPEDAIDGGRPWLSRTDPAAGLIVSAGGVDRAGADSASADSTRRRLPDAVLRYAGTNVSMSAWRASDDLAAALQSVAPVAALLTHDIEPLDESAAGLQLFVGADDVGRTLPHRLLFDNQTFATLLAYWGERRPDGLRVAITLAVEGTPVAYDLLGGSQAAAADFVRDAATRRVRASVPLTGGPMLLDFNAGAADVFAERSGVRGERQLSVAEVIARHQARQRAQDALVRNYVAQVRMEQHFRPTMTDPGYDVVTENRYFVTGADVEWEELSFSVNGSTWGSDRPPFPLLQPEKVLSLPLQLRFDEGYRYRLDGTARVDGYDCYVVRFEPLKADASLYPGTIWVDRKTFARIRVQAVQGGLAAPVVSNEEIQRYTPPIMVGNQEVYLFNGLTARQIMLIAGRNLLVEKKVTFTDFKVNDPGLRRCARGRPVERPRDVPRNGSRAALLRQAGRRPAWSATAPPTARRRWRWACTWIRRTPSRCRSSASTISTSSSGRPIRSWRCCLPACWRAETSSGPSSDRRRSTRASISSPLPSPRAIASTMPPGNEKPRRCSPGR